MMGRARRNENMGIMRIKMTYLAVGLVLALLVGLSSSRHNNPADILYWSSKHPLTWEDFQGIPQYQYEDISAITSSGIVHYKGCKDGLINYKVRAYFEKQHSWVKEEALTDHHLEHEQIHFDITELYARKLRKALSERAFACGEEEAFEIYVSAYLDNWETEQRAYDIFTHHSIERGRQKEWFYKIALELDLLKDFADPEME